nr:cell division cycle-associated protein 3-like [Nerophis lumbriciformis]
MGASESKISTRPAANTDVPVKNSWVSQLIDPRSPSVAINRTPIQVGRVKAGHEVSECPSVGGDPRSPTVGIVRTPMREVMRAKVGTLARRLGMLFHTEAEGKAPREEHGDVLKSEEPDSTDPLLSPQSLRAFDSLSESAALVADPVQNEDSARSPFELLAEPQMEVEIETDNLSLEEAEEARESPFHKRLSMSLITCHEGMPYPQILAEVHRDAEVETVHNGVDHLYALPALTVKPTGNSSDPPSEPLEEVAKELPARPHRLTLDVKSPSQVVFKPQWLGKGFGATGLRARAVQGAKGGASPLAVSVAVKNVNSENKVNSGKKKQKEGRSPLQILKETNSARGQPQMKLKGSTPERPRLGQMEHRHLAVSLNKEN